MSLFLHESIHFFVTLLIAIFIYLKYKNWRLVIVVFAVGIFLDLDHLIDCYLATGGVNVFNNNYFSISQKAYVIFHSWELLIPWWIYIIWTEKFPLGWTVTLTFIAHILIDQFSYGAYPLTYFLSYRMANGFELSKLFIPHE